MAAQIGVETGRLPEKKQSKAEPRTATVFITLTEQLNHMSHIARSRAMEQVGRWLYRRLSDYINIFYIYIYSLYNI